MGITKMIQMRFDCDKCADGLELTMDYKDAINEIIDNGWIIKGKKCYCFKCVNNFGLNAKNEGDKK